ncbi:MAG: YgfZ/GcvT domain-containing protein, partial [Dongiaceae bacterium]
RGLVRKRLLPVQIDGPPPAPGTPVMRGELEVGETRTAIAGAGLALIRLDALEAADGTPPLTAGGSRLTPRKPEWARF